MPPRPPERAREHAVARAEVKRARKATGDVVEPVGEPLRRLDGEEVRRSGRARGARAMPAHGAPIEDAERIADGVGHS
ncbi:MAG TPA: hypothetical protein VF502_02285, partial [Stellaceae bacterium]